MKKTVLLRNGLKAIKVTAYRQALLVLFSLFFFQPVLSAPLSSTLNVTKTEETCLGNGTLSFNVENVNPLAVIEYKIYELPDSVNPIAILTTHFLGGLTSGTYRVIATETLNGVSNSQISDISIINSIISLTYLLSSTNAVCGNDGSITVSVTSGTGSLYEIISGPVIIAPQSSVDFNMLPAGIYQVRVFDTCGEGWVTTHTLFSEALQINISKVAFPEAELPSCSTIFISNTMTPSASGSLLYPILAQYTIFPPDGSQPISITNTITSGNPASQEIKTIIPFYYDQSYTYNLTLTDPCNNVFVLNDIVVNQKLNAYIGPAIAACGNYYLAITATNYKAPLTLTFLSTPAGFNPVDLNSNYPGPYQGVPINFGDYDNPVPFGNYSLEISDGCGHIALAETLLIEPEEANPIATIQPYPGCNSYMSHVRIIIPSFTIVSAVISSAPSAYPSMLPHVVTSLITPNLGLLMPYLIAGDYIIILIDECGTEYTFPFIVPEFTSAGVSTSSRPDCSINKGSIRIRGNNTQIVSALMISAPATFSEPLPYDASINIANPQGIFSMNNLPVGTYSFIISDSCGSIYNPITVNVLGYSAPATTFSITPHCGSFDLNFNHTSNGVSQFFWLQKLNPLTNTWGHPATNIEYPEGSLPNNANSFAIQNNTTTYNLAYTGNFRIVKRFESFENGSLGLYKNCIENIEEFDFFDGFQITNIEKISCNGQYSDVAVVTNGVPPLTYRINLKNGVPYAIDNGNNNVFANLEPAIYNFVVQHACGHTVNISVDVALLPSLTNANQPQGMDRCDDNSNDGIEEFLLTSQNATILGNQSATNYTLTYHLTFEDAANATNPLPDTYISGNQTIYCRVQHNNNTDCFDITSFQLIVNEYPILEMKTVWPVCTNQETTITADTGFDSYLWSTGEITSSITVGQPGYYTVQVVSGSCIGILGIDVIPTDPPTINEIITTDWTANNNSVTVILDGNSLGDYLYSLDNVNFQTENTFSGLEPGSYSVFVKDKYGCGSDNEVFFLLNYPKYFTPNADGIHDFWRIQFSEKEPNLETYIFDRYGKLITGFMPNNMGWDGTYNGSLLPSSDYWFLVILQNGKQMRGHFTLKR